MTRRSNTERAADEAMTLNSSTASPGTIRQSSTAPRAAYENRLREVTEDVRELSQRDSRFVQFRTAIFLGALALGILCIGESEHISWFWMLIPVVLFLSLLPFHQKCLHMSNFHLDTYIFHNFQDFSKNHLGESLKNEKKHSIQLSPCWLEWAYSSTLKQADLHRIAT